MLSRTSFVLFLLVSARAHAQTPLVDLVAPSCIDAPSACTEHASDAKGEPARAGASTAADRDGRFHAVLGVFVTAAGTDLAVSMYQIGRGVARERGFGAAWQDSPVAFAVTKSAMTAATVYGLQRLRQHRPKAAFVIGIAATAVEGWLVFRSASVPSPTP